MPVSTKDKKYHELRKQFPWFSFEKYDLTIDSQGLELRFYFNLSGRYSFTPEIRVPRRSFLQWDINENALHNLAFHLGMIELVSYWKAACAPLVLVRAGHLTADQIIWWKKLYYHGLGEFFYTNGIKAGPDDFMELRSESGHVLQPFSFTAGDQLLVPVGGGKDSTVTLELLKQTGRPLIPFIVNPRGASLQTADVAGFGRDQVMEVTRTIDQQLLRLNAEGFLNGHTPFSALLAFATLLAGVLTHTAGIALSNEASANEATIPGTHINHQYSKSWEFERDFRNYTATFISENFNYFSLLRPLNELQIARIFSAHPEYFQAFKSCNVGSKTDTWCGHCPKCLFTWIMLGPFVSQGELEKIFHKNLFEDETLIPVLDELSGLADAKPFECVGTLDEVNAALQYLLQKSKETLPPLLQHYQTKKIKDQGVDFRQILGQFNRQHFLSDHLENLILKQIQ